MREGRTKTSKSGLGLDFPKWKTSSVLLHALALFLSRILNSAFHLQSHSLGTRSTTTALSQNQWYFPNSNQMRRRIIHELKIILIRCLHSGSGGIRCGSGNYGLIFWGSKAWIKADIYFNYIFKGMLLYFKSFCSGYFSYNGFVSRRFVELHPLLCERKWIMDIVLFWVTQLKLKEVCTPYIHEHSTCIQGRHFML